MVRWSQSPASLNSIYSVLSDHDHPFIMVGKYALRWMGVPISTDYTLDILIRTTQQASICQAFLQTGEWLETETDESSMPGSDFGVCTVEHRSVRRFMRYDDEWYINLCDEDSYRLTVDTPKIQVPHVLNYNSVLVESEFHPNAGDRSARARPYLTTDENIVFVGDEPITFPVFIPTIPRFLDSCLDSIGDRRPTDNAPYLLSRIYMDYLARYLILDSPSQQEKFLAKVGNRERLAEYFMERQRRHERTMERVMQRRMRRKADSTSSLEAPLVKIPLRFEQPQNYSIISGF